MRHLLVLAFGSLMIGHGLAAQNLREATYSQHVLSGPLLGELLLDPNATAQPVQLRWVNPADEFFSNPTLQMPFTRSGGITPVDEPFRFLVSGWGPTDGHLVAVQLGDQPQPGIATEQTVNLGPVDPVRVCWTDQTIFLIDGLGQRILSAPWDGNSPLPTQFTNVIDKTTYFPLEIGAMLDLKPASPNGVVVHPFGNGSRGLRVYWDGNSWQTESHPPTPLIATHFIPRGNLAALPSVGPLTVVGPVGSFSIIDELTGITVGTGVSTVEWQDVVVTFANELVPGQRHVIRSPGLEDTYFTPTVRHGTPKTIPSFTVAPGLTLPAYRGDESFGPSTRFYRDDATAGLSTPASLWIAFRDANGNDPVMPPPPVPPGTTALLTPAGTVDFFAEFDAGEPVSRNGLNLPIPDEPSVEGLIILFQFVAITPNGQDYVASDVFGTIIFGALTQASQTSQGGGGTTRRTWSTMTNAEKLRAIQTGMSWARQQTKRLPGSQQSVYQMIRSQQ